MVNVKKGTLHVYQMDEVRHFASNDTTAGAVGIGRGRSVGQVSEGLLGAVGRTMGLESFQLTSS
jgi:hypothetical protein